MTQQRLALTVLLFAMGAATVAALMTWRQRPEGLAEAAALIPSRRTAPEPPLIAPPAIVPAQAFSLPPLTFEVETTRSGPADTRGTTQTITRTHDRVRLALDGGRQEWLFLQNTVYRDRAAAYVTDHVRREIGFHEESSLRSLMQIRGWMDVLTLRFDSTALSTLRETGERRRTVGATFSRYVATEPSRDGLVEIWWSEELLLPSSVAMRDSGTDIISVVKEITRTADPALLAEPSVRFPTYKVLDPADASDHH